jgi:hypothetical protein
VEIDNPEQPAIVLAGLYADAAPVYARHVAELRQLLVVVSDRD